MTFGLVLLSLGAFVVYVHHIAQAVRAATILDMVADETRSLIDEVHPPNRSATAETFTADADRREEIASTRAPGVITDFEPEALVRMAKEADCVLELVPSVGQFVPTGTPVFRVHGDGSGLDHDRAREEIHFSRERTMQQDIAFGFRQLVDVAIRALSPAVNDPTTAVQALDQLHDLLRRLGTRELRPGREYDDDGVVRLVYPTTSWEGYVELGLEEIRQNGAKHVQVTRRIRALLEDLLTAVPEDRRPPLLIELRALEAMLDDAFEHEHERAIAGQADPKGLGS